MYEHVLLPTDGSEGTERAVEHAIDLADNYDATLHVLSVVDDSEFRALDALNEERLRSKRDAVVERTTNAAAERGVEANAVVRNGSPGEEILAYVDEADIDVIVMGTRGRSGIDRVLLGSVTESVVRQAPVPVMTVRMAADATQVRSAEAAIELAKNALSDEGKSDIEVADDPHRTSGSWIVPLTAAEGAFHVHVDTATGESRVAQLD